MLKIEIWSDFACPYCYIGEKKLEKAIEELEIHFPVEIKFRSFQLNVNAGAYAGEDINTLIANKYSITYEKAKAANDKIISTAKEVGLDFDFKQLKPGNTGLAHEVLKYAQSIGKGHDLKKRFFAAYFEEGIDLSIKSNLIKLTDAIGLNRESIQSVLEERYYEEAVMKDQKTAKGLNISSVPYFIIDEKHTVSGAQSVEYFKMILKKAMISNEQNTKGVIL